MKLTLSQESLIKVAEMVAKVADKHHRFAILGNIKLELSESKLCLTASDLDVELTTCLTLPDGACQEVGSLTVPAAKFYTICKSLPKVDDVKIARLDDSRCQIVAKDSKFILTTLPAEDYPSIGTPQNNQTLTIDRVTLQEMIARTRFCVAGQDVRHYLTGMLFHVKGDKLTLVATDGHRMAIAYHGLDGDHGEFQVIVPGKAVTELERLLGEGQKNQDQSISLGLDDEFLQVALTFSDDKDELLVRLSARLIDGQFPDYTRVIPNDCDRVAYVKKHAIADVLKRVSILADERLRGIVFAFDKDAATVRATNATGGEAFEVLPLTLEGAPLEVAFNDTYLKSVISALDDTICLQMSKPNAAALISEKDNDRYQYVVMPVRI